MPLYEYECLKTGKRFEVIQKFSDTPLTECPDEGCDGKLKKILSAPAIRFKGSGWYVNDYGKGGQKPKDDGADSSEKKAEKKTEKKSEAKSDKTATVKSKSD